MDLSAVDDLARYDADRRESELVFFEKYSKWLVYVEGEVADEFGIPAPSVNDDLLHPFSEMVVKYAKGEIRAYLKRVGRHSIREVNDFLQLHLIDLLEELRIRKWAPAEARLGFSFCEGAFDRLWKRTKAEIEEACWGGLQATLWKDAPQWREVPAPQIEGESGALDKSVLRRTDVDKFLARCHAQFPKIKFRRAHIWRAVGHKTPRQFQYWQRCDGKSSGANEEDFARILGLPPAEFVAVLQRRKIIPV